MAAQNDTALFIIDALLMKRKTAESVSQAIVNGLTSLIDKVLTINRDNGSEFAKHEDIAERLKADFYFAHPYSSWERGLNENTNGLVRQYLKRVIKYK